MSDPIVTRRVPTGPSTRDASRVATVDASYLHRVDASLPAACDTSRSAGDDASRLLTRRLCAWCGQPIPDHARRDAVCCSKRCRQARHRFTRGVGRAPAHDPSRQHAALGTRRLAYADPPYPGLAFYYRHHPDYDGEVDHEELIARLSTYDGWALSTSAAALPAVLALCPPGVRVAAWHRGERPTASRWPLNAWEPVIYHGARPILADPSRPDRADPGATRRVDSLVHGVSPLTTLPGRVIGTKPAAFARWIFDLLGMLPGDQLDDLYPGSGAITRAWNTYTGDSDASPESLHDASREASHDASRPPANATDHPTTDTLF
jgi:hypothetical protein